MKWLFLILLLLLIFFARAQEIADVREPGVRPGDLDSTKVALSMRLIKSSYTGACVNVRRSSDNATQDIGFKGRDFDVDAFNTFVGGGSGYVVTWYDQVGAIHPTQATAANQPQIVLNQKNGQPTLFFDGTDILEFTASTTTFNFIHVTQGGVSIVVKAGTTADPNAIYTVLGNNALASTKAGFYLAFDDRAASSVSEALNTSATKAVSGRATSSTLNQNTWTPNAYHLVQSYYASSGGIVLPFAKWDGAMDGNNLIAGGSALTLEATVNVNAAHNLQIGAGGIATSPFIGYLGEIVIFGTVGQGSPKISEMATNQNFYWDLYNPKEIDADAGAYINAVATAGYSMTTAEKTAVNTYIIGLKDAAIWPLVIDRGLPIWGAVTPAAALVPIKGAITLAAFNSPTFSTSGVDFNGTNQYITTTYNASTMAGINSQHIGFYSGDNIAGGNIDMGAITSAQWGIISVYSGGSALGRMWNSTTGAVSTTAPADTRGYMVGSRTAAADMRLFWNGAQIGATQTGALGTRPTHLYYIGARNNGGTADAFSVRKCQMWSVGLGMTAAQVALDNYYTEQFMDALGIGVQP